MCVGICAGISSVCLLSERWMWVLGKNELVCLDANAWALFNVNNCHLGFGRQNHSRGLGDFCSIKMKSFFCYGFYSEAEAPNINSTSFLSAIWINFTSYEKMFLKLKFSKFSRQLMIRKLTEYLFREIVFQIFNIFKMVVFSAASHEMMCPNSWQEPVRYVQTPSRSWGGSHGIWKTSIHLPATFETEI